MTYKLFKAITSEFFGLIHVINRGWAQLMFAYFMFFLGGGLAVGTVLLVGTAITVFYI